MEFDVFLSYSSKDKLCACLLYRELSRWGLSVWLDEKQVDAGDYIISEVHKGLEHARHFCIIISKVSLQSPWVERELRLADTLSIKRGDDFVIPILIDNVDMPYFIGARAYVDLTSSAVELALGKLIKKLKPSADLEAACSGAFCECLADFSSLSHKFTKYKSSKLDILLVNGGATIPALVRPLIDHIIDSKSMHGFKIRAVFLDTDPSSIVQGFAFSDGRRLALSIKNRRLAASVYEAIVWSSDFLQNIGSHHKQLESSVRSLYEIKKLYPMVSVEVKINPRFPSCRILILDDVAFYTPFLAPLPYGFYSLKIDRKFPLYKSCVEHFEFLYKTGIDWAPEPINN